MKQVYCAKKWVIFPYDSKKMLLKQVKSHKISQNRVQTAIFKLAPKPNRVLTIVKPMKPSNPESSRVLMPKYAKNSYQSVLKCSKIHVQANANHKKSSYARSSLINIVVWTQQNFKICQKLSRPIQNSKNQASEQVLYRLIVTRVQFSILTNLKNLNRESHVQIRSCQYLLITMVTVHLFKTRRITQKNQWASSKSVKIVEFV